MSLYKVQLLFQVVIVFTALLYLMALPPRFPGMIPAYGVQIPQMAPISKFSNFE